MMDGTFQDLISSYKLVNHPKQMYQRGAKAIAKVMWKIQTHTMHVASMLGPIQIYTYIILVAK